MDCTALNRNFDRFLVTISMGNRPMEFTASIPKYMPLLLEEIIFDCEHVSIVNIVLAIASLL